MTRFAFVTWDGGGNVTPAVGMAQELVSRGHDVVFIGYEVQRKRFEGKGLKFVALRRSGQFDIYGVSDPAERIAGLMANVWACPEHLDDVPDAVAATSADVLVVDFSLHGALASATTLPVPFSVLAHSSIAGLVPPPEKSPIGAARLTATNGLRDGAGLPTLMRLNEAWTGRLTLVTTIPALDPAAAGADSSVHYVGPIFESFPDEPWDSPWDPDDDRPMVLVSFTTTGLWDQSARIRNTLEALGGEAVRVLVSASQPMDLAPVPDNAAIRRFVPHAMVLPSVAVTVTHAGHGTVAASLAHGVPLVALPNPVADQPFLAATVQQLGAGLALDGESGPAAIRTAVQEVMGQPSYAAAAGNLAIAIHAAPGVAGAAVELERLAVTGQTSTRLTTGS
jgi:MGT family glycosyltransferase